MYLQAVDICKLVSSMVLGGIRHLQRFIYSKYFIPKKYGELNFKVEGIHANLKGLLMGLLLEIICKDKKGGVS